MNTLLCTLVQLLYYIKKCNHFGMTTMRVFVKIIHVISIPDEELFSERPSDALLHTLSKLFDAPVGFVPSPSFEAVDRFICGRRRVAVARYRMICLVPFTNAHSLKTVKIIAIGPCNT